MFHGGACFERAKQAEIVATSERHTPDPAKCINPYVICSDCHHRPNARLVGLFGSEFSSLLYYNWNIDRSGHDPTTFQKGRSMLVVRSGLSDSMSLARRWPAL